MTYNFHRDLVWRAFFVARFAFNFCGSCVLFKRSVNIKFSKINFKIEFFDTIYIFKNYFITIFSEQISSVRLDCTLVCAFAFGV